MRMRKFAVGLGALLVAAGVGFGWDDKEDLGAAAKKATEAESYTFKSTIEIEGSPMPVDPIEFEGKHHKDAATYLTGSMMGRDIELYKKGDKIVTKGMDGNWQSGGGGGGGRGGRGLGGMMSGALKAPHEELKDFEKKFKEVKKGERKENVGGKECSVYSGDLTEDAAKEMIPMGRMGGLGGAEITGSAKVWVDGDGVVRKYETVANLSIDFQGNQLELTVTRKTEISEIGSTKLEVPEEVKKLLGGEEKKEEPKKDEPKKDPE
jgi:hypothetical protein